jgi:hypothetical protein
MKKVIIREAQRNLCKLLKERETFEIVTNEDDPICLVTFFNCRPTISAKPKIPFANPLLEEYNKKDVGQSEESQNSGEICIKCKVNKATHEGMAETEFDGYQMVNVCTGCHDRYKLKGFKFKKWQIYGKNAKKI